MVVGATCRQASDCGPAEECPSTSGVCACSVAFAMTGPDCSVQTGTTVVGLILALLLVVAFVFTIGIALRHELPLWRRHARALSSKVAVVRVVSMDMSATSSKPSKGRQRVALAMALVSSSPFYLGLTAAALTSLLYGILPYLPTRSLQRSLLALSCLVTLMETVLALVTMHNMLQMCVLIKLLGQPSSSVSFICGLVVVSVVELASLLVRASPAYSYPLAIALALISLCARQFAMIIPAIPVVHGLRANYKLDNPRMQGTGGGEVRSWRGRYVVRATSRLMRVSRVTTISTVCCLAVSLPYLAQPAGYYVQVPLVALMVHCLVSHLEIMRLRGFKFPVCIGAAKGPEHANGLGRPVSSVVNNVRSHAIAFHEPTGAADLHSHHSASMRSRREPSNSTAAPVCPPQLTDSRVDQLFGSSTSHALKLTLKDANASPHIAKAATGEAAPDLLVDEPINFLKPVGLVEAPPITLPAAASPAASGREQYSSSSFVDSPDNLLSQAEEEEEEQMKDALALLREGLEGDGI